MGLLRLLHLPPKKTLPILSAKVVETAAKLVDWCGFLQICYFLYSNVPVTIRFGGAGRASPSRFGPGVAE